MSVTAPIRKLLLITFFFGCKTTFPIIEKGYTLAPEIRSFVLIDGGHTATPGMAIKKKRTEVVKEIKDQYLSFLSDAFKKQLNLNTIIDTTLTTGEKEELLLKDSASIAKIRHKYKSALILVVKECTAGFRQGEINKTKSSDGKSTSKTAEYDVFFDAELMIIQDTSIHGRNIESSRYHSSRSVLSGLLARGPGFEANKEDILRMAQQNAFSVALLFNIKN